MSIFQEKAEIQRLESLGSDNHLLTLRSEQTAGTARPGQFVMIGVGSGSDPLLRRPFSINRVENDLVRILFKVVGRGTAILADQTVGATVPVLGPLGNGFDIDFNRSACLVGGGMGIAPMLFLAEHLKKEKGDCRNDMIILGGRDRSELEPLLSDFQGLGFNLFAATDDGSYGIHGLVTDVLNMVTPSSDTVLYCCGPEPMLHAIHTYASGKGNRCQVSIESEMACGMGACLGCSVSADNDGYLHVCTDGPVFESDRLLWVVKD